jgi:hypothetical protein
MIWFFADLRDRRNISYRRRGGCETSRRQQPAQRAAAVGTVDGKVFFSFWGTTVDRKSYTPPVAAREAGAAHPAPHWAGPFRLSSLFLFSVSFFSSCFLFFLSSFFFSVFFCFSFSCFIFYFLFWFKKAWNFNICSWFLKIFLFFKKCSWLFKKIVHEFDLLFMIF